MWPIRDNGDISYPDNEPDTAWKRLKDKSPLEFFSRLPMGPMKPRT